MNVSRVFLIAFLLMFASTISKAEDSNSGEWIQLFNGRNLDGWIPKIRYHKAGENFGNTFRVEDGVMKVGYDKYDEFGEGVTRLPPAGAVGFRGNLWVGLA